LISFEGEFGMNTNEKTGQMWGDFREGKENPIPKSLIPRHKDPKVYPEKITKILQGMMIV
jgi:hypothetical protein